MTQLGRYEILQQLATGPVADVLLARATGLEGFTRHVVIKQIRPELALDERFVKAFLDEARIGASLHHQNIVQVYDIDEERGAYYFTMEYVHGEDVRKLLLKVRELDTLVPIDQVVTIGAAAAAGLHHAHEQVGSDRRPLGLVHRDVSPGNILIGFDGSVKLVDFGLAKPALKSIKTRTGSISGKAPYMSPELCCGKPIDRRSDIFALGIVLYELVTARRLFKADNDYLTMASIVEGDVAPPSAHRPDVPRALDEIIMRALARAPEARYQSAVDFRAALEAFAMETELRTTSKSLADYMVRLFGARAEPWQADAPKHDRAIDSEGDFDESTHGLVTAPTNSVERLAALATDTNAPIAVARNLAGAARHDPDFDGDAAQTKIDMRPDEEETSTGTATVTASVTVPEALAPVRDLETAPARLVAAPTEPSPTVPPRRPTPPPRPATAVPRTGAPAPAPASPLRPAGAPRPAVLGTPPRPSDQSDADGGDEATTVSPPLFEAAEPLLRRSVPAPPTATLKPAVPVAKPVAPLPPPIAAPLPPPIPASGQPAPVSAPQSVVAGGEPANAPMVPPQRPTWIQYLTVALGFAIPLAIGLGTRSCDHTAAYGYVETP